MPDRIEAGTILCAVAATRWKGYTKKSNPRAFGASTSQTRRMWV